MRTNTTRTPSRHFCSLPNAPCFFLAKFKTKDFAPVAGLYLLLIAGAFEPCRSFQTTSCIHGNIIFKKYYLAGKDRHSRGTAKKWNIGSREALSSLFVLKSRKEQKHSLSHFSTTNGTNDSSVGIEEEDCDDLTFTSRPARLYIGDTDAYGVMYHGNYIRSYERALYELHTQRKRKRQQEDQLQLANNDDADGHDTNNQKNPAAASLVLDRSDFRLTRCTNHRFKSSPTLGSRYVIRGTLVPSGGDDDGVSDSQEETWSLEMVEYVPKHANNDCCDGRNPSATIYNTALVTIASASECAEKNQPHQSLSARVEPFYPSDLDVEKSVKYPSAMYTNRFTIHRDEFDAQGLLPMTTVLDFFERLRTDVLGGPDELRNLQENDNLLFVVTSLNDLEVLHVLDDFENESKMRKIVRPGDDLEVRLYGTPKRKGMLFVCEQELWGNLGGGIDYEKKDRSILLAKGICTICTIDSLSGRPTSNIPERVRASMETTASLTQS